VDMLAFYSPIPASYLAMTGRAIGSKCTSSSAASRIGKEEMTGRWFRFILQATNFE
jgi:hypothetical protein